MTAREGRGADRLGRMLLALLMAPLAALPAMFVAALARGWAIDGPRLPFFLVHLAFAYAAAIVFGLPLHLVLRKRGWRAAWLYALLGGAIAAIVVGTAMMRGAISGVDAAAALLAGGAAGLLFRAIAGAGRAEGTAMPRAG